MTRAFHPSPLERLTLDPATKPPQAAVIWLHGLGADGHDFAPLFRSAEQRLAEVKVLLPHAPERPVTVNGGMPMRAWYDIRSPELSSAPDLEGIRESAAAIGPLVDELEAEGIAPARIVLGGFSQGAVLALWTGLGLPRPLAGIAALSGYLPDDPPLDEAQRETPIFMGHGRSDGVVPFSQGEAARDRLAGLGCREPEWHPYPMDHGVSTDEAGDLLMWLGKVLQGKEG